MKMIFTVLTISSSSYFHGDLSLTFQVCGIENFHPPELIQKESKKRTNAIRPKNIFMSLMGISVILVTIWKHKSFIQYFQKAD